MHELGTKVLTYIEVDVPYCSLTYGVPPCQASLVSSPPTGTDKCFNTLNTCQDRVNIDLQTVTLRFAVDTDYLPKTIDIIASSVLEVEFSPAVVSLGENLGQRASLKVTFKDHPHSDAGEGLDKYYDERAYNPFQQGTFWGKFRARQPFIRGAVLRWRTGFVGDALVDMETRHFFIESFDGPTPDGKFTITAKDALKFLDGDRAQAPVMSNGFLVAAITDTDTSATLSPSGIGDTEYPAFGYVNIGGNEVAYFSRDPYTKLLLHFDGTDGATSTSDTDVANPATVSFTGTAAIDTADSKFGGSSVVMGGAGNNVSIADSVDWFLDTGNFTIDLHCKYNTVPSGAPNGTHDNILFQQFVDASNRVLCGFDGTNILFIATSGGVARANYSAAHGMTNGVWHHWRFVRSGTSFFIFRDGVSLTLTVTTAISTNSLPNLAASLQLGGTSTGSPNWMDEFRWRKGIADTTSGFTPPTAAYSLTGSGDDLRLTRGQFGSVASSHSAQDRVQLCLRFDAQDPADIIADLLEDYTDTPVGYIQRSSWLVETGLHFNRLLTAMITEPTPVNKLISEVVEQAALAMWDDNINQHIDIQVLRAISTLAATYNDDNVVDDSFINTEQPDKRVSRVWVYFGQIDPTKRLEDPDNFRSTELVIDATTEADYGSQSIKKIFSRWIPALGRSVATRLGEIVISRYSIPPRKFTFQLFRNVSDVPRLGAGYRLNWWNLQDALGARENVPIQVNKLLPKPEGWVVDAEEMLFTASGTDLSDRQIVIDFNTNNVNLKDVHDSLYPALEVGQSVTCTIMPGVIIGSTNTINPAFDVGTWDGTPDLNLVVLGRIQGTGGKGGNGNLSPGTNTPGSPGGTALYARQAINLTDASGEIWGGGGGGGGNGAAFTAGGGGGGGAGQLPGEGGLTKSGEVQASPGTTEAGGVGGSFRGILAGGTGGGPGLSGVTTNTAGGAAGSAIDGLSFITTVGSAGDRRGAQIN